MGIIFHSRNSKYNFTNKKFNEKSEIIQGEIFGKPINTHYRVADELEIRACIGLLSARELLNLN